MKNPISILKSGGKFLFTKYLEIILAVGLFILLDTGVLILNFYTSYQIANDAHAIQLASRMGTLTQRMVHELYQVRDDARNPQTDYDATIDVLGKSYKAFDEIIDSFIYGGTLIGVGQGQDALLEDTTYRDTSAHLLKDAEALWKKYRVLIKPIVYAYFNETPRPEVIENTEAAIAFARQNNAKLLELMEDFAMAVEGVAQRKAERLRMIQTIGISLAILNFFLILFHFLRRLSQGDAQVEKARKETGDILQNVDEGLFLIDRNFQIGSQHSQSLYTFFKQKDFKDQNFIDLLMPLVTEKTLETVKEYAEILFSPKVDASLVTDLNPLHEIEINLSTEDAGYDVRYYSFQFVRVYEKTNFEYLLVTVKDITHQAELEQKLKAANEQASRQINLLLGIMHIDHPMLTGFLENTRTGLRSVNNILKTPAQNASDLMRKLETISRIIHKLKGDSTAIGLEFIEEKFHGFEEALVPLKKSPNLSGKDFLPVAVRLNQLMADFAVITDLQHKIAAC